MGDMRISDIIQMQKNLWEAHKDEWSTIDKARGSDFILYMVEEIGECIAILKKKGEDSVRSQPEVREHFLEELSDVMMYMSSILLYYDISPAEFTQAFEEKYQRNLTRKFSAEYEKKYTEQEKE